MQKSSLDLCWEGISIPLLVVKENIADIYNSDEDPFHSSCGFLRNMSPSLIADNIWILQITFYYPAWSRCLCVFYAGAICLQFLYYDVYNYLYYENKIIKEPEYRFLNVKHRHALCLIKSSNKPRPLFIDPKQCASSPS